MWTSKAFLQWSPYLLISLEEHFFFFVLKTLKGYNNGLKYVTLNFSFVVINSTSLKNLINTMGTVPKQKLNACGILKGRHILTMKYSHKEPRKPNMKVNDLQIVALIFVALTALFIKITTIFKERLLNFDYIAFLLLERIYK